MDNYLQLEVDQSSQTIVIFRSRFTSDCFKSLSFEYHNLFRQTTQFERESDHQSRPIMMVDK